MKVKLIKALTLLPALFAMLTVASQTQAAGMLPETSIVIVDEADGEASINVKNTDANPALLYTAIEGIKEDDEDLLIVAPPVARVDPGQTQLVRFILQGQEPLKTQRLRRVIFDSIPPKNDAPGVRVGVSVRQNLPVLLHPAGLAKDAQPWKKLQWSVQDGALTVENPSPYVVRMAPQVWLLPEGTGLDIGRTYILPGQTFSFPLSNSRQSPSAVRISPATTYGFVVDKFEAPVNSSEHP